MEGATKLRQCAGSRWITQHGRPPSVAAARWAEEHDERGGETELLRSISSVFFPRSILQTGYAPGERGAKGKTVAVLPVEGRPLLLLRDARWRFDPLAKCSWLIGGDGLVVLSLEIAMCNE